MSLPGKDDYIKYRLDRAHETYEVAKLLVDNKAWNSAVNRLYYAAYYAISALLIKSGVPTKTHAGVKTQFLLHFIKSGKINLDYGKVYADLFDWRQKGDYGDFFDFKEEDLLSVLEPTRLLIIEVERLIHSDEEE